jgi:hypothetical protein
MQKFDQSKSLMLTFIHNHQPLVRIRKRMMDVKDAFVLLRRKQVDEMIVGVRRKANEDLLLREKPGTL